MRPLRIAFVAAELAPFAKTGGLGDVALALPRALGRLGHDVRVVVPRYGVIDPAEHGLAPASRGPIPLALLGERIDFTLLEGRLPRSEVPVYFVDCPPLFGREAIYTNDEDEPLRFLYFSRAALEACQRLGFAPDVLHANDWQTALVPLLEKTVYAWDRLFGGSRSLLTLHNVAYQGVFSSDVLAAIGVRDPNLFDGEDLAAGRVNFLKTGLLHADGLSTVSPTYALEIQTEEQGYGLDPILRRRRADLTGILNGVDAEEWDPSRDGHIPFRYSAKSLWRKKKNKQSLMAELGLEVQDEIPLVGMVSRLSHQKGIELLYQALPDLLARAPFAMAVLGTGERRYEEFFTELEARYRGRVCFYRGFHDRLAHFIEAGADMLVMPSRYEPCGLNQMYSMLYGTIPIVRRTGGLADSVRPFDPSSGEGTGVVFDHFTGDGLRWALGTAFHLYREEPESWRRMMRNGMSMDFSWERQAKAYVALYRQLLID